MNKWLRKSAFAIIFVLLGIIIGVLIVSTIFVLRSDPQLSSAYVAFGTLLLAAATGIMAFLTYMSIRVGYDRERRSRKERLLNEITDWAIGIAKCESESPMTSLPITELVSFEEPAQHTVVEHVNRFDRVQLMRRYQAADASSEYIKAVAGELDKKFGWNLLPIVRKTATQLANIIMIISKNVDGQATEEEYNRQWHSLIAGSLNLTRKAAKIKTKEIG